MKKDSNKITIISHETLLRPNRSMKLFANLKKLENYLGKIKILVSVRKQTDIIFSRYFHDIFHYPYLTINQNLANCIDFTGDTNCSFPSCFKTKRNLPCSCIKNGIKPISLPYYDYYKLL